jgi:hypothetical protein
VSKKQFLKVTGFIGTLAAGTALVASAATGTGAWFTDSASGTVTASTGHLNLETSSRSLDFRNLVPGEYNRQNVTYTIRATGKSDVWLVFERSDPVVQAMTGSDGLGRYGHFSAYNDGGQIFTSNNLASGSAAESCNTDPAGHGGSSDTPKSRDDKSVLYCPVPEQMLLASNVSDGFQGVAGIEFGVTGFWTAQNSPLGVVPFKIVATQHGHGPNDANF